MSKPSSGPLSEFVRSCPDVSEMSATEQDRTGQNKKTPPTPPRGERPPLDELTLQGAARARQGSQRKRDLDALAIVQASETEASTAAERAFATAIESLAEAVAPTQRIGVLAVLRSIGVRQNRIVVSGPAHAVAWAERRYALPLSKLVRDVSDFDGVMFAAPDRGES